MLNVIVVTPAQVAPGAPVFSRRELVFCWPEAAMVRPEKLEVVEEIKQRFTEAEAVFFTEFAGLSVTEQQELRRGLRASAAEYKIFKLTLARLAVADLGHDELSSQLFGPTGLAFAGGDPVLAAKALRDFAHEHTSLLIKGAFFSGELLSPERVAQLADLQSRDVLLSRLAGAVGAPLVSLAGLMAALLRNSATLFARLLEEKQGEQDAEAGEPSGSEETEPAVSEDLATEAAGDLEAGGERIDKDSDVGPATVTGDGEEQEEEEDAVHDEAKNSGKET